MISMFSRWPSTNFPDNIFEYFLRLFEFNSRKINELRCFSFSSWFYISRISSSNCRCLHSLNSVKTIRLTMRFLVLHEIKVYSTDVLFISMFQSWNTHRVRQVFQTASNAYIWKHGEAPFQDEFSDVLRELGVWRENSLETIFNWLLFHYGSWFSSQWGSR